MQLLRYTGWLLRCCYAVARAFWGVSRVFLFGCYAVAKVLRVVAKWLLGYSEWLLGCYVLLHCLHVSDRYHAS